MADFSPGSLRPLEKWYFELHEQGSFAVVGITRERFEECLSMYFGEVLVRDGSRYEWFVSENPISPGRFSLCVGEEGVFRVEVERAYRDLYKMRGYKPGNRLFWEFKSQRQKD